MKNNCFSFSSNRVTFGMSYNSLSHIMEKHYHDTQWTDDKTTKFTSDPLPLCVTTVKKVDCVITFSDRRRIEMYLKFFKNHIGCDKDGNVIHACIVVTRVTRPNRTILTAYPVPDQELERILMAADMDHKGNVMWYI